jgi:oligoribonuclease (3'-5' exoribonuclease)
MEILTTHLDYNSNDAFKDELSVWTKKENMKKIIIPESWSEVTISQLREILELDTTNKMKYAIEVASILSDTDTETIRGLSATYLNEVNKSLGFINDLPKLGYSNNFTVDGQLYAVNDFKYFTLGQWIDIEMLGKDWKSNLHKILAVIYLPATEVKGKLIIEKYDGKIDDRAEVMDKMKVSEVYSASVFFSNFGQELIVGSSLKAMNKEIKELKKNLPLRKRIMNSGTGIKFWIGSQVNRLSIWRRWRRKTL